MIATALSTGSRTLRSTRSLGALRTAAGAQQQPAIVPALPSRSLVSTVLLTREVYDKRNVAQLKDECKQRGLTTSGKRADIVARLLNDDAKQNGSGLRQEEPSRPSHRRSNSSLASLRGKDASKNAPSKASQSTSKASSSPSVSSSQPKKTTISSHKPASSPAPDAQANSPVSHTESSSQGATIKHPDTILPGQVAHAGQHQGEKSISTPTKLDPSSNPPGVPPQKEPSTPTTFRVQVPYEQPLPQPEPEIPVVTMYTRREAAQELPTLKAPKVVTAASTTDVSHALQSAGLDEAAALPSAAGEALSSAAKSLRRDVGLTSGAGASQLSGLLRSTGVSSVGAKASEAANAFVQDASVALKNIGQTAAQTSSSNGSSSSFGSSSSSGGSSKGKRPLNAEEKRGLYILGGILISGFAAGGLGKSESKH